MRYKITINEVNEETGNEIQRYEQIVDAIDMLTVINAVNSNAERRRAQRSDAGKPRPPRKEDRPSPGDFICSDNPSVNIGV